MLTGRIVRLMAIAALGLGVSLSTIAADPPEISELSRLDLQYMSQQKASVDDLARRSFGDHINGNTAHDLDVLQRLLDRGLVRPEQTQLLQAMGMILGDSLAEDLDMHWVIYEDHVGRSRALRYRQTEEYLFPVTMISRRREADNRKSVADIYQKAYDIIAAARPALPFE